MTDIVNAGQQIRVKIWLEMRIKQSLPIHIQLVLIGINHIAVRLLIDRFHHLVKGIGRQSIIVVS